MASGVPYWRDVGTVDAYWEANLDLTHVTPDLNLYDEDWPIWTHQEQLPPAKFVFDDDDRRGQALDSMVSGGCIISGSTVRRSLLFSNVQVRSYSNIEDSVILPNVDVGRNVRLRRVVVDKNCIIPPGLMAGFDPGRQKTISRHRKWDHAYHPRNAGAKNTLRQVRIRQRGKRVTPSRF